MSIIIIVLTLIAITIILNEILTILVYGIVSQVHEKVVNVALFRLNVRLSCKSGKSIFEKKYPERIHPIKQHVDSEVEFQIVYQEWVVKVSLSYVVLRRVNIIRISCQKDTFPLTRSFRLNYESYILRLDWRFLRKPCSCKLRFKFIVLNR